MELWHAHCVCFYFTSILCAFLYSVWSHFLFDWHVTEGVVGIRWEFGGPQSCISPGPRKVLMQHWVPQYVRPCLQCNHWYIATLFPFSSQKNVITTFVSEVRALTWVEEVNKFLTWSVTHTHKKMTFLSLQSSFYRFINSISSYNSNMSYVHWKVFISSLLPSCYS